MLYADMLQHTHGYDAIEATLCLPVVLKREIHLRGQSSFVGSVPCDRQLLCRERYAPDIGPAFLSEVETETAPPGPDVQDTHAPAHCKLRRNATLLVQLRHFKRVTWILKECTRVLLIAVKKQAVELCR